MRGKVLIGLALLCIPVFGLGLALGFWTLTQLSMAVGLLGMAVTANQVMKRQGIERSGGPVYQSTHLYEGAFCFWNTAGYLTGDTDSGASKFAGIVIDEVDNSSGSDGDKDAEFWIEGIFELSGSGFAITDIGKEVFASDNYTITLTDSASAVPIGSVAEYVSATVIRVRIYGVPHQTSLEGNVIAFTGSTGANEIRVPDNLADALSIEGTHGDFIVFTTTNAAEAITVAEATTFSDHVTFSGAIDVTFSGTTGQCEIKLTDNLADALSISESTNDYIVFTTTNGSELITFGKAATFTGEVTLSGAIDLVFSGTTGQSEIMLTTNLADALSIKDSAADIIVFATTTGSPTVTITPPTTVTGLITSNGGITLSGAVDLTFTGTTGQPEIVLTNNLADALSIKDGTGDLLVFVTTTGQTSVLHAADRLGFYDTTPAVQPSHIANATNDPDNLMAQVNSVISALETLGLLAAA